MEKSIGKFIAVLRKANGYTQESLADVLGVSNKTISSWETDNSFPDLNMIPILAELFHVSCDEILKGERTLNTKNEESAGSTLKFKKRILKKQMVEYKNMQYISIGIFLVFLFLYIPGVLFINSLFGIVLFILSLCIYVGGIIFSRISYNTFVAKVPEEENFVECNRFVLKSITFIKCLYSGFLLSFFFCHQANKSLKMNPKYEISEKELECLKKNAKLKRILFLSFLGVFILCCIMCILLAIKYGISRTIILMYFIGFILLITPFEGIYFGKRKKIL